jgi:CheY-like chemotaxis protein
MKKRAVVVDDNARNRMLEKDLLEVAGFEVYEAENGADGIAQVRKEKPDIIVMDVRLPDMLGTEAIAILRRDKTTSGIPVVFVTSSVMPDDRGKMTVVPNSGFISKPIDTRTFAAQVRQFIQ